MQQWRGSQDLLQKNEYLRITREKYEGIRNLNLYLKIKKIIHELI